MKNLHASHATGFVYYEAIKREPKIRGIYECRCDERLKTKTKEFTRLTYTGFLGGLEHLKIETRLIDEKFPNTNPNAQSDRGFFHYQIVDSSTIRKP